MMLFLRLNQTKGVPAVVSLVAASFYRKLLLQFYYIKALPSVDGKDSLTRSNGFSSNTCVLSTDFRHVKLFTFRVLTS